MPLLIYFLFLPSFSSIPPLQLHPSLASVRLRVGPLITVVKGTKLKPLNVSSWELLIQY